MARVNEAKQDATLVQPPPLKVSRVFHAPRETVFRAWSSADHVKRWFSPETYSVSDAIVEMRVGGPFEVCMRSPRGEAHWTKGTCRSRPAHPVSHRYARYRRGRRRAVPRSYRG